MNETQPAFVAHCADLTNRKMFYIQVCEGPPSSRSFKVFDENDHEVETIGSLSLQFSDVSETYKAVVGIRNPDGIYCPTYLNIVGIQPWLKNSKNSNGTNFQS